MEDVVALYEKMLDGAFKSYRRAEEELSRAVEEGHKIAKVLIDGCTKQGDIITVGRSNGTEDEDEENEMMKARVVTIAPWAGFDKDQKLVSGMEAICIILHPGEVETLDEFASMYGNDDNESQSEDSEESSTYHKCSCGADLQTCEKNQEIFGLHLQE